jgi:hypothetical protein
MFSQEGLPIVPCNRASAVMEAEMRMYAARKRSMIGYSIVSATIVACVLWIQFPYTAAALFVGVMCGIANALLSMWSNERLLDHRSVASFVFGSVLRIGVFGIVSVEFGMHGPAWTIGVYFIGFFTPLGWYALNAARTFPAI